MADTDNPSLFLSPAPHYAVPVSTPQVMFSVVAALLPLAAYGVYLFGIPALVTILVSVVSTVVFEALFRKIMKQDVRVGDFSAVITGLLLALILPPATPVWMTVLGAFFAIVGRAFMLVSFTTPLTTWMAPRMAAVTDGVSAATPLSFIKPAEGAILTAGQIAEKTGFASGADYYWSLFMGQRAGSIGESGIFLILIAFVILVLVRVIDWRAPVAMMVTAAAVTALLGVDPLLTLLSGGLVFGAVFMATDYATSPVTPGGRLLFGAGCGLITALIRVFGGYPEGVMFSILIMNALVPFLNKIITRKYGWVAPAKKEKAAK